MHEFQPRVEEERGFDEAAQQQIIAMAAALQRDHGQRATLSDLERAAMEAGIEPRFIREAVEKRRMGMGLTPPVTVVRSEASGPDAWLAPTICTFFVLAEYVVLRSSYGVYGQEQFSHSLAKMATVGFLFGIALPNAVTFRRLAAIVPIVSVIALTMFRNRVMPGGFYNGWYPTWLWLGVLQAAIAVIIHIWRGRGRSVELTQPAPYRTDF